LSVSLKQTARAVTAVEKMTQAEKVALCDEMFEHQPDVFFLILGLSQEGVSHLGADYALQRLMVIYCAMKNAGCTRRVSREHLQAGAETTHHLMNFLQGGVRSDEAGLAALSHPEVNLMAYVVGDMKEQGLLNGSSESGDIFFALKTVLDGYAECNRGKKAK